MCQSIVWKGKEKTIKDSSARDIQLLLLSGGSSLILKKGSLHKARGDTHLL